MGHDHADLTEELRSMLRERGLRATHTRMSVLTRLHERRAPMTHEEIMESIGDGHMDRATVWRILSDLAEEGILRRMDLGDRVWRYELLDACRPVADDHGHFLCETCGLVQCLPPLQLRTPEGQLPEALQGAEVRMRLTGRCGPCAAS